MIQFNFKYNCTKEEMKQILIRASKLEIYKSSKLDGWPLRNHIEMCLATCNGENGNYKLDFKKLHDSDDFNFAHDIVGIEKHLNKENGKLELLYNPVTKETRKAEACFIPRCAITENEGD